MQTYANIPTEPEDTTKTIADLNPLRYRGYYYDTDDLGFYYLQSRYYDADTCRFISADSVDYIGITGSNLSYNTFAYCENNPTMRKDDGGEFGHIIAGAIFGGLIGAATQVVTNLIEHKDPWEGVASAAVSGAVGGALTAAFPQAHTLISAGMSAVESVVEDVKNGENVATIITNATVSAGFAVATSGESIFGNKKIVKDTFSAVGKVTGGNHPAVKKAAKQFLRKTGKALAKEVLSGFSEGLVVHYVSTGTKWVASLFTSAQYVG